MRVRVRDAMRRWAGPRLPQRRSPPRPSLRPNNELRSRLRPRSPPQRVEEIEPVPKIQAQAMAIPRPVGQVVQAPKAVSEYQGQCAPRHVEQLVHVPGVAFQAGTT